MARGALQTTKSSKMTKPMTPAQALASFNAAELRLYEELKAICDLQIDSQLWWWWTVGQRMAQAYRENDAETGKRKYGKGWMERESIALFGYNRETQLRRAIYMAEAWPKKGDFNTEVIEFAGTGGNKLMLTQVQQLANIKNSTQRQQMALRCVENGWSAKMLDQEIAKMHGKPRRISCGFAIPATTKRCLKQICGQTDRFSGMYKHAWSGTSFDLVNSVQDIATPSLDDELLKAVATTKKGVELMVKDAADLLTNLVAAEKAIRKRIPRNEPDEGDVVNLGEEKNKKDREKRAAERKKKEAAEARKAAKKKAKR